VKCENCGKKLIDQLQRFWVQLCGYTHGNNLGKNFSRVGDANRLPVKKLFFLCLTMLKFQFMPQKDGNAEK